MTESPWRPDPETAARFLAELATLYDRYGCVLTSREPIGLSRLPAATTTVRVRAKFRDPEDGELEEYGPEVYDTVAFAVVEADRIRAATFETPRAYIDY